MKYRAVVYGVFVGPLAVNSKKNVELYKNNDRGQERTETNIYLLMC